MEVDSDDGAKDSNGDDVFSDVEDDVSIQLIEMPVILLTVFFY
jgi:hypothetical protein